MSSLADLVVLNLGARLTKLLVEVSLGKGARATLIGDVVDVFKGRIQSAADQKKAQREFEELGDRMARELLPLFESARQRGQVEVEAVALALESTLSGLANSHFLAERDLESGTILRELKQARPLPIAQLSQAEEDLYERALERAVRQLVEIASRLPRFEEAVAARSLQQLTRVTTNVDEILAAVSNIEKAVGTEALDKKAREYEIDYRRAVRQNLDYLEIFGIDLPPESRYQKLSVAYITLTLESLSGQGSESLLAEALFDRLANRRGRLLIRGDAGTGKSTLLRWVAREAAAGSASYVASSRMDARWRDMVPFLIRLRQCRAGSLPSPDEFPELVAQALGSPPAQWARSILNSGRALVLLDGVDEIPNAHRETIRHSIADLISQYADAFFVISTRPRAVDPDWLENLGFREARINPLSDLDRSRFIDRWHEAVGMELSDRGKPIDPLAELSSSLKKELDENPEVARLASNPLLCAMICALHRDRRKKLPERQRQLCEDLCHAILHRRERESGLNLAEFPEAYRRLDYPQKRAAVQELAHHMVLNGYSSVPTEESEDQIANALRQFPGHSAADAATVTESLVERSGILREESPREISFIHNAFKELLAGDYFASADAAGLLARHALDPEWQQTILFAVAADHRGFATKVIQRILEPGTATSLAEVRSRQLMALRCRASALYLDEKLDLQLHELSADLFPPRTMEDAEALAAGGNSAVPFLRYNELTDSEAAASIRALRLIGTPQARQVLRRFLGDRRSSVVSELSQAVNPLEIEWIKEQLIQGKELDQGFRAQVDDLSPLAELEDLQHLFLSGVQVADLAPLAGLKKLQTLYLAGTPVENLAPLANLKNLYHLNLAGARVVDLSPLAELGNLQSLFLTGTLVMDLSPLARLQKLQTLFLNTTLITNLAPLAGLRSLQRLDLTGTRATDLSPLKGLNNLRIYGP